MRPFCCSDYFVNRGNLILKRPYGSLWRRQVVMDSFADSIQEDYIETTKGLLKGDYGFMCQYDNEPCFETVWSSIFDLQSLTVYRAEGDPRKKKFIMDNRLHDIVFGKE